MGQRILIYIFVLLFSIFASAADQNSNNCNTPKQPNELFWCLVNLTPEVRIQKADIEVKTAGISQASQMINPSLSYQTTNDDSINGVISEASLQHTFELGGKRKARENIAKAHRDISQARLLSELENTTQRVAIRIHRLRQIITELQLIDENIETYQSILKQYKRTGRLNPEQSVSFSIFEIAEEENILKKESLLQEKNMIVSEFQSILGVEIDITSDLLPKMKSQWPTVTVESIKGSTKMILEGEVHLAASQQELEKSESWPNLSVGPRIEHVGGNINDTYYGVAVNLPLPVLSLNRGGRTKASREVEKFKLKETLQTRRLNKYARLLVTSYQASTKAIERTTRRINIKKRHHELHKLLKRGIINSALVIELHREVYDYYNRLHQQELTAVEALWTLYALNGSLTKKEI
ncbi:MAG: TolC family protein [Bdellovibrionales bacterium]|nr:TolC family protein [Bdellovibrionales bacterium]